MLQIIDERETKQDAYIGIAQYMRGCCMHICMYACARA